MILLQWNLYNETGKVSPKTDKFVHLSGRVFTKSCWFSLSWKTTCLERPQNLVVALYRFHCNRFASYEERKCHFSAIFSCYDVSFQIFIFFKQLSPQNRSTRTIHRLLITFQIWLHLIFTSGRSFDVNYMENWHFTKKLISLHILTKK